MKKKQFNLGVDKIASKWFSEFLHHFHRIDGVLTLAKFGDENDWNYCYKKYLFKKYIKNPQEKLIKNKEFLKWFPFWFEELLEFAFYGHCNIY